MQKCLPRVGCAGEHHKRAKSPQEMESVNYSYAEKIHITHIDAREYQNRIL